MVCDISLMLLCDAEHTCRTARAHDELTIGQKVPSELRNKRMLHFYLMTDLKLVIYTDRIDAGI